MSEYPRSQVKTRKELVALLKAMSTGSSAGWENRTAEQLLGALASWLEDADGFYDNLGEDRNCELPDWQLFADALQAATVYE